MSLRTTLETIQQTPYAWAVTRAGYMLALLEQKEQNQIELAQLRDYMYDVMRRLEDDAGSDDQELRDLVRGCALELGEILE